MEEIATTVSEALTADITCEIDDRDPAQAILTVTILGGRHEFVFPHDEDPDKMSNSILGALCRIVHENNPYKPAMAMPEQWGWN